MCEALSFTYRYVPVGLLERLPAKMNDRPYPFKGRDDLETLLASSNSADWVKISEMFLGPSGMYGCHRCSSLMLTVENISSGVQFYSKAQELSSWPRGEQRLEWQNDPSCVAQPASSILAHNI